MTSQLVFYHERAKRVCVSFWVLDDEFRTTLTLNAHLTPGEARLLVENLNKTLASIPPEPRVVSAEDLGL